MSRPERRVAIRLSHHRANCREWREIDPKPFGRIDLGHEAAIGDCRHAAKAETAPMYLD